MFKRFTVVSSIVLVLSFSAFSTVMGASSQPPSNLIFTDGGNEYGNG